jgi:hypothetical protein
MHNSKYTLLKLRNPQSSPVAGLPPKSQSDRAESPEFPIKIAFPTAATTT